MLACAWTMGVRESRSKFRGPRRFQASVLFFTMIRSAFQTFLMKGILFLVLMVCWVSLSVTAAMSYVPLRGSTDIHDPSTIIKCKDRYYTFGTGPGILSKSSADKVFWVEGPPVFVTPPAWVTNATPAFNGDFWAPDILQINGRYCLYYSVSTWQSQVSAIGLATNPTLDPEDPDYQWTDQGIVIQSFNGSAYNTIDPSVTFDADGDPWMAFGSYWNGIYLVELDPLTGQRIAPGSPLYPLASNSSIEACCLYRRGQYYYLFVNWGSCCSGVNSTYHVRVGRSTSITGPYRDRNGVDLRFSGGTVFMEATGKFTGPGHVGILAENGEAWFSYHYYDAGAYAPWYGAYGAPHIDVRPLQFSDDDWPVFENDWSAVYNFQSDARDENGQYYGLLEGGASIQTDPDQGRVLNLSGANQTVWLPPGVANARTFSAVVKWNGGGAWQRIFDFGVDTSDYVMLTPSSSDGRLRCDLRVNGVTQVLEWNNPLPVGIWTHVAVTFSGSRGLLYVDGVPVATNSSMSFSPFEVRAQTNHLGRSKFVADPDFSGQIATFSSYGRALSGEEIAAPRPLIAQPPDGSVYWPGSVISFNGSATDFSGLFLAPSNLEWKVEQVVEDQTNTVFGPASGITNGSFTIPAGGIGASNEFYRIQLVARGALSLAATNSLKVFPTTTAESMSEDWDSFYPFTTGADDANNHFNGTLVGGASIIADSQRAQVLNLSGSAQYVNLPPGVGGLKTFSGWVKWYGGGAWQRIFDFGVDTSRWLFLTPKDGSGRMQCALTYDSSDYVRVIQAPEPLPVNEWVHVAVVFDGRQGILYINGQAVAVNNSVNLLPSDIGATKAYFGKSQFSDPYLRARLDSVGLNSRPLSISEIIAPTPVIIMPAAGSLYAGGETVSFYGAATDYAGSVLAASHFTWSSEFYRDGEIDSMLGPWIGVTNGMFQVPTTGPGSTNVFYRLTLHVVDANGHEGATFVDLEPLIGVIELVTVPSGLQVELDGDLLATPASIPVVAGFQRLLNAPSPQNQGGTNFSFVVWSNGGPAAHLITVPATNRSYTASYENPTLLIDVSGTDVVLRWPDWAAALEVHSATNLTTPVVWSPVLGVSFPSNGLEHLTLPLDEGNRFYRLQSQ